jgi:phospholipase/carboxylesterase
MTLLDSVEINPKAEPYASIIWLHGLGADGHDFEPIVPELRLPDTRPIRFVFPHAPKRPVTINAGMIMRAWYDVIGMPGSGGIELDDFFESVDLLNSLIQKEMDSGMPSERILLAGFSQGGAISLYTGLLDVWEASGRHIGSLHLFAHHR